MHSGCGFTTLTPDGGWALNSSGGRTGLRTNSPPQFGQTPSGRFALAQAVQKVHSIEQIIASSESGGRSRSQHSQFGRNANIQRLYVGPESAKVSLGTE
jgi:hypothetical protein